MALNTQNNFQIAKAEIAGDVQATSQNDEAIINSQEKLENLNSKIEQLSNKFDVWQNMTDAMLANVQTAMDYTDRNLIIAALIISIFGVGATIIVNYWFVKSKEEAVEEVIKDINRSIAEGILPEGSDVREKIIDTVINSEEFQEAVTKISGYSHKLKEKDDRFYKERLEEELQQILTTIDNLKKNLDSDD